MNQGFQRLFSGVLLGISIFSLLFSAYVLLRLYCVMSFRIPTDSMSPALLPGDCVLATQMRLGRIDRGDVLFFNFPFPERWDSIGSPRDGRFYAKRCVGLPGDTVEIRGGRIMVRGYDGVLGNPEAQDRLRSRLAGITSDSVARSVGICLDAWPGHEPEPGWTVLEFGPLMIPAAGTKIELDTVALRLYRTVIEWETGCKISELGNPGSYTFRKNYYFVAGDNAENSQDSRYWGLLPQDHIRARALRVWWSRDPASGHLCPERIGFNPKNH